MDRRKKGFKSEWGDGKADNGLFYSSYQSNRLNEYILTNLLCFGFVIVIVNAVQSIVWPNAFYNNNDMQ